ncbi:MAG: M23 family metallopeptidase [Lachnospiraceae bacterium]|nr:M23 family metallopeptidase [Lachnospiraceae bacterium]
MKFITRRYKRLKIRNIKLAVLAALISLFFFPSLTFFEPTGDNSFTIFLNGQAVGVIASVSDSEWLLREARRRIAIDSEELILMDSEVTYEGDELLWGEVDENEQVVDNMTEVLRSSVRQTKLRSYTVKINEYMVNLASKEEVTALLQAAVDKYDMEGKYEVGISPDIERELSVLTPQVQAREALALDETATVMNVTAGIDTVVSDLFASVEPAVEKDFGDYDLGLISINYGDTVEVVEAYLAEEELTDVNDAIREITKEQEKNEIYEVVSGDTLSEIAIKVNIPMDKIIEMNEGLEDEHSIIHIGEELVITVPEPALTVERSEELYIEEDYEEEIIYVDNDDWFTTQMRTLQEPSAGHRRIIAVTNYRNDTVVSREIIKEEITYQAVPKIVERGTKIPPTYIKPLSGGRLSSGFGRRNAPTRGASSNHKGLDWATPVGTAIVASATGTVVKAGWGSGYGYVVYINHADGRQTRYAHLSKVLVSVGQTVTQGERIALSGNTGVSSGPHVHLEILINGSQVNPLQYLD